jgi:hypothetical protein
MHDLIISPHGLTRIFEGMLVDVQTREGKLHHRRMIGFRHVSRDVVEGKGYRVKMDEGSCPDNRGVWSAKWFLSTGRSKRQNFFPAEWTREKVLAAIAEANETREPTKWQMAGSFYLGRTNGGMKIVLELDESGQVVDAIPRRSTTNFERRARWRVEHGYSKRSKYFCHVCGELKRGHPLGHPTRLGRLYWRVRRHVRKFFNDFR